MDWDEEHVIAAGDTVGYGGTLWILYLTNSTEVGINKTSDYHTQQSSVRSFTKRELGLPEPKQPVVREGYMSISNKPVTAPTGTRDVINNEHKNDLLSLTTLGHKLVTAIRQDDRLDMALRGQIGVVDEPNDPWWIHGPANDDHAVFFAPTVIDLNSTRHMVRSMLSPASTALDVVITSSMSIRWSSKMATQSTGGKLPSRLPARGVDSGTPTRRPISIPRQNRCNCCWLNWVEYVI